MHINWPLITLLFCLSLPGVLIAIPRLIHILLPENSELMQQRVSRLAIIQTLIMVLLMSFAGAVISSRTGLGDPLLDALLHGQPVLAKLNLIWLPALFYTLAGLFGYLVLYYGLLPFILDKETRAVMQKLHLGLGIDGCVLYGGVVEEVLARWGLMNLAAFFVLLIPGQSINPAIGMAIVLSGIIFAVSQFPAYLAAGCKPNRTFIFSFIILMLWQSTVFGLIFWQFGLLVAIVTHMLFHFLWALVDYGLKVRP